MPLEPRRALENYVNDVFDLEKRFSMGAKEKKTRLSCIREKRFN